MLYIVNDMSYTSREEAIAYFREAMARKEFCTAGMLTVSVHFPAGRDYLYFADRHYQPGDKVIVPTPDGLKVATVGSCQIHTKSDLKLLAKLRGFDYKNYKEVWGPVVPQDAKLTDDQQAAADTLYHALLGWARGNQCDARFILMYLAKNPNLDDCVLEYAAERAAKFGKPIKDEFLKFLNGCKSTAA